MMDLTDGARLLEHEREEERAVRDECIKQYGNRVRHSP